MSVRSDIPGLREHGNAYNIFILVLTIYSLAVMVLLLLPVPSRSASPRRLRRRRLRDLPRRLRDQPRRRHPKSAYFIRARGWLDLPARSRASGPSSSRAVPACAAEPARPDQRLLSGQPAGLVLDVVNNRGQYATFITILLGRIVLIDGEHAHPHVESRVPDANIRTGGDALGGPSSRSRPSVTATATRHPMGRVIAFFVMLAGVGLSARSLSILGEPPRAGRPAGDRDRGS